MAPADPARRRRGVVTRMRSVAEGEPGNSGGPGPSDGGRVDPVRVFVSYAHDNAEHEDRVREF
jgi:hypothetical protein